MGRPSLGLRGGALAAFLSFSALLGPGCGDPQVGVGTNTNWMRACDETADCGDEDACLCGRCTSECASDDDCAEGVCAPAPSAALQCAGEPTRTCQPSCDDDDDCDSGRLCHHGVCADSFAAACPEGALYCQDFEDDLGGALPVVTSGNTLERVEVRTPSGEFALEAVVTAAPSVSYLRAAVPLQSSGELYLSGWVRVPTEELHDVAPLAYWAAADEGWALRAVIKDGSVSLWSNTTPHTDSIPLSRGEWACITIAVTVGDGAAGSARLFVDGEQLAEAVDIDTLPATGIEAITMGTLWAGNPATVLVDRVIASTSPISCYE